MYDLIIIGAGASGIYLGNLTNKLMNVLILEASDRIGGRIQTKKYNNKDINIGAEYVHFNNLETDPFSHNIMSLLDENTTLIPIKGKSWLSWLNCDWCNIDGKILNDDKKIDIIENVTNNPDIKNPNNFWEEKIFQRLYFYVGNYDIDRQNQLYGANTQLILNSSNLIENKPLDNDSDWYLLGSYNNILNNIIKKSKINIIFNNYVFEITYHNNYYLIKTYDSDHNIIEYKATYVTITIPLGCLKKKTINFIPSLPYDIQLSIDNIGYGHHNKVIVTLYDDYNLTNENYFIIENSIIHWSNYNKNILIGHILGSNICDKNTIIQHTINDLRILKINFKSIDVIDWRENDLAGNGSYSYLKNVEDYIYVNNFSMPIFDNTLFFCGEGYGLDGFQTVRGAFNTSRIVYKKLEQIIFKTNPTFIDCSHFDNLIYKLKPFNNCENCDESLELWKCLECEFIGCGRYKNKCMIKHYNLLNHALSISYPEKSIWCYKCNAYINYNNILISYNGEKYNLITNDFNFCWKKNKDYILNKILPMENNNIIYDLVEINNQLTIIIKLKL